MNKLKKFYKKYKSKISWSFLNLFVITFTPWKIRKFADSVVAACIFAQPFTILSKHDNLGYCILIAAMIGKFLSDLFSEKKEE